MPAVSIRNANGQERQMATSTIEKNALLPISQNDAWSRTWKLSISTWLIRPLSRWNMKLQVMTPA